MNRRSVVLIVDDLEVARDTMAGLLAKEPYDLAFANDGYDALEKAQALTPDVILLDVMMPGIDGYEVCRHLRNNPRLNEVPIVMLTALDDRDSRLEGIEAGADDFISKPFDRVELRARLRTILRLNRYRRLLAERTWNNWVVERADVGYAVVDAGDTVIYANPVARLYLGMPPAETDASPGRFRELISRQYRAEPQEAWNGWPDREALEPEQPRYLVRPETGTSRPFWLQVTTLDQSLGPEARHLVCLRNVTDEMNGYRERATFQAMMMHKVRTPLMLVRGGAELLGNASLSGPQRHESIRLLQQGVENLCAAVNDIWQYIEAAPMAVKGRGVFPLADLASLLSGLAEGLGLRAISLAQSDELSAGAVRLSKNGHGVGAPGATGKRGQVPPATHAPGGRGGDPSGLRRDHFARARRRSHPLARADRQCMVAVLPGRALPHRQCGGHGAGLATGCLPGVGDRRPVPAREP